MKKKTVIHKFFTTDLHSIMERNINTHNHDIACIYYNTCKYHTSKIHIINMYI